VDTGHQPGQTNSNAQEGATKAIEGTSAEFRTERTPNARIMR